MAVATAYLTNFRPPICPVLYHAARIAKSNPTTRLLITRSASKLTRAPDSQDISGTDLAALKKEILQYWPHNQHDQTVTWLLNLNGIRRKLPSSFTILCFLSTPQDKSVEELVQHLNKIKASWAQMAKHPWYAGSISVPGTKIKPSATVSGLTDITQVNSQNTSSAAIHIQH